MQVVEVTGMGNVEFPDDMSHEDIIHAIEKDILPPPQTQEELPDRSLADYAKDIATTGAKAGIGIDQAAVGIADLLPGVNPGKFLEEHGVDFNKMQKQLSDPEYEYLSPQQQEANKSWNEAKTLGEHATSIYDYPSGVLFAAGEAIPAMLAGGLGGKAIGELAGIKSALARGAIGEAGITAGQSAEDIRSQSPDKELDTKGKLSALGQGAVTGAITRVGGKLTEKLGGFDPDTLLTGGLRRAVTNEIGEEAAKSPGAVQRVIASIAGESLFEEAPQAAQEALWTNFALDRPLLQGVDTAAIKGGILGGIIGGGAGSVNAYQTRGGQEQPAQPEAEQPAQPGAEQPAQPEAEQPAQPQPGTQDTAVDIQNGVENSGVSAEPNADGTPTLYDELTKPERYASHESLDALDTYKKSTPLPNTFDDAAWDEHIAKQRERLGAKEEIAPEVQEEQEPKPSIATSDENTAHTIETLTPYFTPQMRALVKSGKLTLHDSLDTFPGENHPEGVQGLTTPQGEVHLLANKLTPESMPRVALHEMGVHVGMKGMVGDKVWGDLTSQALTTKGDAFEAARRSVPEDTPEHLKGEETLAYLVENAPHLPIVKRTVAAIKNWIRTTFGVRLSITEADIHHLATKALRKESLTSARSVREGTAYAQKPRENSRIGMPHEQILQRVPELTESAKKMMDVLYDNGMLVRGTKGNLAKEVSIKDVEDFARSNPEFRKLAEAHDALVEKYKPVEPYQSLPTPATEAEMQGALKDKQAVNINRPVPDGYKVKLRLDIPAYKRFGVWAVTAHEGNTKKNSIFGVDTATPLAYYGHAVADNPKFSIEEANALKIAGTTRDKYPLATVDGEYVNMSAKEAKRLADEAMTDPDWAQVGMDPERHSYFYDRKTMQPIKSGSRVIQIGSILMVKDPVYGKKSEYVYSVANKLKAQVELDKKNVPTAKESWTVSKKPMMSNLTRAIDIFEQQYMSHDAVLVNSLRRYLEKIGAATEYTLTALTKSNQMQTVNVTSVAAEFTMEGGGDFDSMGIWSSKYSKDNLVSLRQLVDDGGAKQGWTQRETHAYFTNYMVSKRILELFEEAETHEATANAIVDKDEKAVWLEKAKEIRAVLKRDGANKAKSQATADAYGSIEEFVKAEKMWHAVRANLIKTLVKSGLFSQEKADAYAKALAYVPFNRVMENLTDTDSLDSFIEGMGDNNVGGHRVSALTNGMSNKKLKGSERDVMDIMSNMEAWSQISFTSAIRAKKATDLIDVMRKSMPVGTVTRVHGSQSAEDKAKTVVIYSHGKKQSWMFEDALMVSAFRGTPSAALIVPLLTASGNIMRSGIVLAPTFTIGQLPQDIYSAFFTAGIKNPFKLAYDLATEFGTTAFSKKDTDTHQILKRMGAVGAKDNIADSKSTHIHDISFHTHYDDETKTVTAKAWRGLKTKLEKFAMAGDNAIRQAVYKRSMEELKGNPNAKAIATQRAFDVINFRRRGASAVLEQWRSNVPFMGAAIQAQRATFQVIAGRGLAHQDKAEVYKRLVSSSLTMMAMSLVYNVLYGSLIDDDDEFKKKSNRDKDSRIFLLGGNSPVSLAIRPDIWSMPFVGGNHLYQALVGREDAAQTRDALLHTLFMASGLGAPMTPPLLKEIAQYGANYDFFTERPIVPERLQRRATAEQYDTSTSELGKIAGKVGMSPIKFDHIVSSLFSGAGKLVLVASNVASFASNVSVKDHSLRELVRMIPGTSSIVPVGDSFEATNLSYKVRREVETANNTYNSLVKDKLPAEAKAYKLEHKALLNPALITATNLTTKTVDDLHAQLRQIHNSKNLNAAQKKVKEDLINKKVQVAHERYSKWYHKLPM